MTYALLISIGLGALSSAILAALWQGAKGALLAEKAKSQDLATQLTAVTAAAKVSEMARADDKARLEQVITQLKKEIATLEASAPHDPAAVRARLQQLLGGVSKNVPVPGSGGGQAGYGGVPFGLTTKP